LIRVVSPYIGAQIQICPASYLSGVLTGALGFHSLYWGLNIVYRFFRQLSRLDRVQVRWNDPGRTPAIQKLSRLLGASTLVAAYGFLLVVTPVIYTYEAISKTSLLRGIEIGMVVTANPSAEREGDDPPRHEPKHAKRPGFAPGSSPGDRSAWRPAPTGGPGVCPAISTLLLHPGIGQ
jgi:hypothetical protein